MAFTVEADDLGGEIMGIFDALKKRSKRTTVDIGKLVSYWYHDEDNYDVFDEEDYKVCKFFGDLSMSGQKHPDVKSKSKKAFRKNNIDSDDSIVYLSYLQQTKSGWFCSDCGTLNPYSNPCCAVCGNNR